MGRITIGLDDRTENTVRKILGKHRLSGISAYIALCTRRREAAWRRAFKTVTARFTPQQVLAVIQALASWNPESESATDPNEVRAELGYAPDDISDDEARSFAVLAEEYHVVNNEQLVQALR